MPIILLIFIVISVITDIILEFISRMVIKYKDIQSFKDIEELERNIDAKYSPAVASMLYDNRIEPKKDIIAVILNLNLKGCISLYKNKEKKYEIKLNTDFYDTNILSPEENYIYNWIVGKKDFNFVEWVNIIKSEYNKLNTTKKLNCKRRNKIEIILMVVFFLMYIIEITILQMYYLDNISIILVGAVLVPLAMIVTVIITHKVFQNKMMNSMKDSEVEKWIKFKRFMSKYTLIKERKPEEIVIYEKYLPFAMALNVNKEYKTIWKDIIPRKEARRIMLHYRILENIFLKPFLKLGDKDDSIGKYYKE